MEGPPVTAVMPAYHAAAFVGEAVASLLQQTVPPREVIVVDDGSPDDTAAVAERAGARVIRQANGGPAAARNTGIRAAATEWIALLDADDLARPTRLATQQQHFGDPAIAVVFAGHARRVRRLHSRRDCAYRQDRQGREDHARLRPRDHASRCRLDRLPLPCDCAAEALSDAGEPQLHA